MKKNDFGEMKRYCFNNMPMVLDALKCTFDEVIDVIHPACEEFLLPIMRKYFRNPVMEKYIKWNIMKDISSFVSIFRNINAQSGRRYFNTTMGYSADGSETKANNTIYIQIMETTANFRSAVKDPKIIDKDFKKNQCEKELPISGFRIKSSDNAAIWIEFDVTEEDLTHDNFQQLAKYFESYIIKPLIKRL